MNYQDPNDYPQYQQFGEPMSLQLVNGLQPLTGAKVKENQAWTSRHWRTHWAPEGAAFGAISALTSSSKVFKRQVTS